MGDHLGIITHLSKNHILLYIEVYGSENKCDHMETIPGTREWLLAAAPQKFD